MTGLGLLVTGKFPVTKSTGTGRETSNRLTAITGKSLFGGSTVPEREINFDRRQSLTSREEHKTKMGDGDGGEAYMAVELEAGLNADRAREISGNFQ